MAFARTKPDSLLARFLLGDLAAEDQDDASLKACCAYLYQQPALRWVLGDSYHPGGQALTRHLGSLLGLTRQSLGLDVAGGGWTARLLAEAFGARVVSLDLGLANLPWLQAEGRGEGDLCQGDAEALPFTDAAFDAVVCECSFCLFPHKERAAAEFRRVLRPGGRLGISDVTVAPGTAVDGFRDVLGWIACVADARPLAEYGSLMEAAGLRLLGSEDHTPALAATLAEVRKKLLVLQVAAKVGEIRLARLGDSEAREAFSLAKELVGEGLQLTKRAQAMVEKGALGYCLLIAEKAA